MATAGDGPAPYQTGGVGGKFRKRPIRRSAQATPYDRPPTALRNNTPGPGLFSKLVDPASRLIYAGADRLFGVFRKRLSSAPALPPPETNEEPRNGLQEEVPNCNGVSEPSTDEGQNKSSISAATEISELEKMLKQKTFTRSEIERLTALLHSRTTESDVGEGDMTKLPSTTPHLLRLEASTSHKHVEERENFHATAISTPIVNSKVFEEDVASPADLAKAYMGTRPSKVSPSTLRLGSQAPRQDSALLNNTTVLPRTPITSLTPRTTGNFTTPRSRGRSAIYNMARTPYYRGPSTLSQKGIKSDYGHGMASPSLALTQPAWEHEGSIGSSKMALKRRSSALDDIGSGGPVRRIRQKANLLNARQQSGAASPKLLLRNAAEPKGSKAVEENGVTSKHTFAYASVPTKSTQMATKILEQLERLSPKEKPSSSRLAEKSPTKSTSLTIHGQALEKVDAPKFLQSSLDNKTSEGEHATLLTDARESTSRSKAEENGPKKFVVPHNLFSSMNGKVTVPNESNVTNTDSALPPQKKRAFQMSAHEDYLDLDDENHSNGHVTIPLGENKKPATSIFANKDVSADVHKSSPPTADKVPKVPEFKKVDDAISPPKTDVGAPANKQVGFNLPTSPPSTNKTESPVVSQATSISDTIAPQKQVPVFPTFGATTKSGEKVSPFSFSANETSGLKPTTTMAPQKQAPVFPTFGATTKNAEKVSPFSFSANESSGFKPSTSPDAKPVSSTSLFNSTTKSDQVQVSAVNKDDNANAQKSLNMFGNLESSSSTSPSPLTAPASGIFSFGGSTKNSTITNGTPSSSPPPSVFASSSPFEASATNTNKLFNSSSSSLPSTTTTTTTATTTTTTTTASAFNSVFSTSTTTPAPVFSFGAAAASSVSATVAPFSAAEAPQTTVTKDKDPKSEGSPLSGTTSFGTGGGIFGFSSPAAATSTTNGFQSNAQASVPFKFGSSTTSLASGTTANPSSTSGNSLFGSSAPSFSTTPTFGLSSGVASSDIKSGSSTTTNVFGSGFSSTPSFGLSSAVASSETKSASGFTSSSTTNAFGSSFGSTFGSSPSTGFSFGASSTSLPSTTTSPTVFGASNPASAGSSVFSFSATTPSFPPPSQASSVFGNSTPVFGATTASPSNNDQMSMEDSMAEDSTQTPSPVPAFGQSPGGFMFGAAAPTPTPTTPSTVPFQFGGQTNQAPPQNPFQASGSGQPNPFQASASADFNAGGSFSLGSGGAAGGDKSGRRILRVKSKNRRK